MLSIQKYNRKAQVSIHHSIVFFKGDFITKDDLKSIDEVHKEFFSWLQPNWIQGSDDRIAFELFSRWCRARKEQQHSIEYELFCFHSSNGRLWIFLHMPLVDSYGGSFLSQACRRPEIFTPREFIQRILLVYDLDVAWNTYKYIAERRIPLLDFDEWRKLILKALNPTLVQLEAWKVFLRGMAKQFTAEFEDEHENKAIEMTHALNPIFTDQMEEWHYKQMIADLLIMVENGVDPPVGISAQALDKVKHAINQSEKYGE